MLNSGPLTFKAFWEGQLQEQGKLAWRREVQERNYLILRGERKNGKKKEWKLIN